MSASEALIKECPQSDREAIYTACRIVAMVDGRIWREADVLDRIGDALQFSKKKQRKISKDMQRGRRRCNVPSSDVGKQLMFRYAVEVASADGRLTEDERRVVLKLGKRLSVASDEIERQLAACNAKSERLEQLDVATQHSAEDRGRPVPGELDGDPRQVSRWWFIPATAKMIAKSDSLEDDLHALQRQRGTPPADKSVDTNLHEEPERSRTTRAKRGLGKLLQNQCLHEVEASPQFANRKSPERLAEVAETGRKYRIVSLSIILGLWSIVAAGACFIALNWNSYGDPALVNILGGAAIGIAAPTALLWRTIRKRRELPINSLAARLVSQRTVSTRSTNCGTESGRYYMAEFESRRGGKMEVELRDRDLAAQLEIGDTGVLFLQGNIAVDFECVRSAASIRERHIQAAVICDQCETVYQLDQAPENCRNCGARLSAGTTHLEEPVTRRTVSTIFGWMEGWSERIWKRQGMIYEVGTASLKERVESHVTCGWCLHHYPIRPRQTDCLKCGGVLHMPAGYDPGSKPLPPPREIPRVFVRNVRWWKNGSLKGGLVLIAFAFCCFCLLPVSAILFFCGSVGVVYGMIVARRRIVALKRGTPVLGQIENIRWIGEEPVGSPESRKGTRRVFYRFEADGEPLRGMLYSYDSEIEFHFIGEPIWIVYVPGKPHICAAWPPFA